MQNQNRNALSAYQGTTVQAKVSQNPLRSAGVVLIARKEPTFMTMENYRATMGNALEVTTAPKALQFQFLVLLGNIIQATDRNLNLGASNAMKDFTAYSRA